MKLTNPTDAELNAAFAEHVCGWKRLQKTTQIVFEVPATGARGTPPGFTTSADAVLPWLEKAKLWNTQGVSAEVCRKTRYITQVMDYERNYHEDRDESFAKSAVIALLRAHGVEIEFIPTP